MMRQDARPLYSRLLRLNHLQLRGPVAFALFEGSIGVAGLLALAEIVSGWGLLAIPAAVALMVKLNDIVAGSLAFAHLSTPCLADGVIVGRSSVPQSMGGSSVSQQVGRGAVESVGASSEGIDRADWTDRRHAPPTARGQAPIIARGVAAVPAQDEHDRRLPGRAAQEPEPPHAGADADAADIPNDPTPPRKDPMVARTRGNQGRFSR